jgi:hypothetical protein
MYPYKENPFFPYPPGEIAKLVVRKCYRDVYDLFLCQAEHGKKYFGISGTPGIGKSLFFIYILHQIMSDSCRTINVIVYHFGTQYHVYDLREQVVFQTDILDAGGKIRERNTLYVVDGSDSIYLQSTCLTLFICSPRSKSYKNFVKQKSAVEWFFPVWSYEEIRDCQNKCYEHLSQESFKRRFDTYGGIARYVFFDNDDYMPRKMEDALGDLKAVEGVRAVGVPTDIFPESHTLMHMLVGNYKDGRPYQFLGLDLASRYVGEQLWLKHHQQMINNMKDIFGGSPSVISGHLFEIYGHLKMRTGTGPLKVRDLDDDGETIFWTLQNVTRLVTFGKNSIPNLLDPAVYYEATDDTTFPAIGSFSCQGMFQFTVAGTHPIRGTSILREICELFDEPKLFFVVPPHLFNKFKKQQEQAKSGKEEMEHMTNLKQYVIELPILALTDSASIM